MAVYVRNIKNLHGVILPANDELWNKIYPPNGWNCRCRVRGLMTFQVEGEDLAAMRQRVLDFLATKEWKMQEAQGWGVNRCDTAQIFTADQMYIRKFPEQAASYLKKDDCRTLETAYRTTDEGKCAD